MSTLEEQVLALQQQLATLQAQIETTSGPTPMQSADDTAMPTPMQPGASAAVPHIHSLDTPIHNAKPLPESERKAIIEAYPPMAHLDYNAPNTIPSAERLMNRGQKYQDTAIKQLQYLLSAAFRPLDILTNEMFTYESGNPNMERYSVMLRDTRRLLLHVCSMMTQQRTNIALRAHNPPYRLNNTSEVNYTLPLNEFQQTLVQQHAAMKATREATVTRKPRRFARNPSNSGSSSNGLDPSFFRSGPPSQQGGFNNNTNNYSNFNNNNSYNNNANNNHNSKTNNNNNSFQQNKKNNNPFRSRLSKYFQHWTNITKNSFVLNTVQHGYYIPFHTTPPTTTTPTSITPFSAEQATLINQAIQDLLAKSAIEPVSPQQVQQQPGFYSSMFVIPKKNGGVRPVFNLKRLNQFLEAPHFKMETIKEVSLMIKPNDYLVSIDLSDAFLYVCLHPESRRFLRLKWRIQVYQYCTTAFGLSSSPFVFTKVCRPILEHLRSRGFRISTYLDDWLLIANSRQQVEAQTRQVVSLLEDLGWLINYKKSVLTPTQQLEHLGFVLNTRSMTAILPASKLRDIRRSIKQVLDKPHRQSPRVIHSLTMRIQSAAFAIFPARLYTRHLLYYKNQTVRSDMDWDKPRPLDQASLEELQWRYQNISKWDGRSLLPSTPNQTMFVDASNTGWGCSWKHHRAHGY
ncbi:GTP-binding nuclear protein gsp1/Ran [Mucor velutinosus]|uniref:GTP-binding nuclear protein gsp1/Ran n=1 Tax=Mucor velutinosus TaxID=708070 RepID=A0AAN7HSR8_9FUNG|nr:GTP-binding nuclear protein gsp1/Ran [Mucor velutinosus]